MASTVPEPPDMKTRRRMANLVLGDPPSKETKQIAEWIIEGLMIYDADTDVLTLTTIGYLTGPLSGTA
jgi:hypothetical protein